MPGSHEGMSPLFSGLIRLCILCVYITGDATLSEKQLMYFKLCVPWLAIKLYVSLPGQEVPCPVLCAVIGDKSTCTDGSHFIWSVAAGGPICVFSDEFSATSLATGCVAIDSCKTDAGATLPIIFIRRLTLRNALCAHRKCWVRLLQPHKRSVTLTICPR